MADAAHLDVGHGGKFPPPSPIVALLCDIVVALRCILPSQTVVIRYHSYNKLTRHFFWIDPSSAKFEIPRAESTAASRFSPSKPERSYNMSYYDNPQSQWSSSTQNNWEHQGSTTPVRAGTPGGKIPRNGSFINPPARSGASGPQPQDDYAFSYQFDGM